MPPALSRKTTRGPNYEASIQAARDLLEQDENFIVVNRQRFTDNLHALVVFSLQHRDLEAPLYGVLNHILMHYCLTVNVAGAGFSTSPQSVFGTDLGLNPDEFVGLLRSWRVPDFANIFAFLSSLTSDAPTASPILAFWCEVKPSQSGDWRQIEHQSHCRRLFFFNLFQLRTQAVHAFVHYPAERHWAFMVTGFYVTAVEFENPNWKKAKEARSRRGGASQPGTDSILSLRPDDLPIKIVFLAEPLFLGSLHQLQVNPLFLSFLRKASAHSRANFQPSFLQMGTNYELPRQLQKRAMNAWKTWKEEEDAEIRLNQEKLAELSLSPTSAADTSGAESYQPSEILAGLERVYVTRSNPAPPPPPVAATTSQGRQDDGGSRQQDARTPAVLPPHERAPPRAGPSAPGRPAAERSRARHGDGRS